MTKAEKRIQEIVELQRRSRKYKSRQKEKAKILVKLSNMILEQLKAENRAA